MIGRTLSHYAITAKLGEGGMGEVWQATDTSLNREVAIKVLPAEMAADAERLERFKREAQAIAALNQPNIVTIYSVEEADGIHLLTMELVEGKSLDQMLPAGGFELDRLFPLAIQIADALAAAHEKGIIHRDLKPANVMVTDDGRVKVLDFGLAKLAETGDEAEETQLMTQAGMVLGTVPYMSPEGVQGQPVDHRSDIFSFGIVLYEMATGGRPFRGDNPASVISAVLKEQPPSLTRVRRHLPNHLGRIVRRCLEKDPERRYQSTKDLRNDLHGLRAELTSGELKLPPVAPPPEASGQLWKRTAFGLGLAVVVLAGGLLIRGSEPSAELASPGPSPSMEMVQVTSSGRAWEASLSPDGAYVVHEFEHDGLQSLRVTHVATGSHVDIFGPAQAEIWDPIFAPDGDFIYYIKVVTGEPYPSLYRVPVLGGTSRKVLDHVNERISFSPEGGRFVFARFENQSPATAADARARESRLLVANLDGSNESVIATRTFPDFYGDPVWSPDGSWIAVNAFSFASGDRGTIVIVPAEGGPEEDILPGSWYDVGELAWLPDGSGLLFTAQSGPTSRSQIWELSYPGGEIRRITNDLEEYGAVGVNRDGTVAVAEKTDFAFDLWLTTTGEGPRAKRLTFGGNVQGQNLSWAGDGRIVFESVAHGNPGIWSVAEDGGEPVPLTPRGQPSSAPSASADGRTIVYVSDRGGATNVWKMNGDGSDPVRLTRGALDEAPEISPDGRWVVYVGGPNATLHRIPSEGGEAVEIHDLRSKVPRISPDGKRVAVYAYYEKAGTWKLDVLALETGRLLHSAEARGTNLRWTADGEGIAYAQWLEPTGNVHARRLEGGLEEQLTHFDEDSIQAFAWSPDRGRMVVTRGRVTRDLVLLKNFR
jgi:serine/threonine protein kinase